MTRECRYQFRLDATTRDALHRLANADDRSMGSMLRMLIREAAAKKGLWVPERPSIVRRVSASPDT